MDGPDGLGSWPTRRARISPLSPALVGPAGAISYVQLAARVDQLAGALRERGVGPGDRVAQVGVNAVEVLETFFAAWRLGAIAVPVNHRLAPPEVTALLASARPTVLVHSSDAEELVAAVALPASLCSVLAVSPVTNPLDGDLYERVLSDTAAVTDPPRVSLDEPALILYTSGTSGLPKGAVLTHGNLWWNTVNNLAHIDTLSTDRALCVAPLFHCVGIGQITLPTLFKGGSVEPIPKVDPAVVLERIAAAGITSFSAVPTILQMICEHPAWETTDLSSLRVVQFGGSAVPAWVTQAWLERGVVLQQGYGMTEAAPGVMMATAEGALDHPVSVGVPHLTTDIAMMDGDRVVPVHPGPAELAVRGPHVFAGYWEDPQTTEAAFVDGWYRTGDVLEIDDDGWAHVVDRAKDMYISGGENVYPAEVEAVLVGVPWVRSAAVVGVPDERWGETGVAFIEPREDAPGEPAALAAMLRGDLGRALAPYKRPSQIVITDSVPRNATGKIRRVELRDRAMSKSPEVT